MSSSLSLSHNLSNMSKAEVSNFLSSIKMSQYIQNFETNQINGYDLSYLTMNDFKTLGIQNLHDKNAILKAIKLALLNELKLSIVYSNKPKTVQLDFDSEFTVEKFTNALKQIFNVSTNLFLVLENGEILMPNLKIVDLILLDPQKFKNFRIVNETELNSSSSYDAFKSGNDLINSKNILSPKLEDQSNSMNIKSLSNEILENNLNLNHKLDTDNLIGALKDNYKSATNNNFLKYEKTNTNSLASSTSNFYSCTMGNNLTTIPSLNKDRKDEEFYNSSKDFKTLYPKKDDLQQISPRMTLKNNTCYDFSQNLKNAKTVLENTKMLYQNIPKPYTPSNKENNPKVYSSDKYYLQQTKDNSNLLPQSKKIATTLKQSTNQNYLNNLDNINNKENMQTNNNQKVPFKDISNIADNFSTNKFKPVNCHNSSISNLINKPLINEYKNIKDNSYSSTDKRFFRTNSVGLTNYSCNNSIKNNNSINNNNIPNMKEFSQNINLKSNSNRNGLVIDIDQDGIYEYKKKPNKKLDVETNKILEENKKNTFKYESNIELLTGRGNYNNEMINNELNIVNDLEEDFKGF